MNIVGLICEYNPFHTGHKYQIDEIKKQIKGSKIVCVMSGDFVQRGDVAIMDKHTRASISLENGADLVLQLPTFFCTQVAGIFASGAVSLLDSLGIIDYLCFGSETGDVDILQKMANTQENSIDIKENLKNGNSFIKSYARENNIANTSNDILAVEYIKALKKIDSNIKPITIKRKGSAYNEKTLDEIFSSATSIREFLKNQKIDEVKKFLPDDSIKYFDDKLKYEDDFFEIIKYAILSKKEVLREIFEIVEGIENKILTNVKNARSFEELIMSVKSKRYTYTRIRRMIMNILLDIKKQDMYMIKEKKYKVPYVKVLGFNENGRYILKKIKENGKIKLINKVASYKPESEYEKMLFYKDILATNIYNIPKKSKYYDDYISSPIKV